MVLREGGSISTRSRFLSVRIPLDDGFLQRQCPYCSIIYAIDPEEFEARGLLNLRCPSCGHIAEAEHSATQRQGEYRDAIGHHELMKMAEETIEGLQEELGKMFDKAFRGNKFVKVKRGQTTRPELSGPQIPAANYECEWVAEQCPRCSFRYRVTEAARKQCPVCRE